MPTATTTPYYANPANNVNPFTTAGAAAISSIAGQTPAPISASVLGTATVPTLPQAKPTITPATPTIPSIDSIMNTPDTPLDTQFKTGSQTEAALAGQLAGKTAYQTSQETANDIIGKKKTVTDLTTSLNNLKAEADQIPLQFQNDAAGRGETVGGLSSLQASATRSNTIKQLGVSAMLNAANGNLATATDQVTAAVKAKFDPIQAELDAQKAQLEAITPLLNKEEAKQAAKQSAALSDRQAQITKQQGDQKTIYQTMLAAAQNGADAVTLQNIQNAATPDAAIAAAGSSLVKPNTQVVNANGHVKLVDSTTGKTIADLGQSDAAMKLASDNAASPTKLTPYLNTSGSGTKYVDLSALSASEKGKLAQVAAANGLVVITNTNEAADLKNIQNAYNNLNSFQQAFTSITSPSPLSRIFNNLGVNPAATYFQTDAQKVASKALNDASLDLLKSISGVQGFRGNQAAIDQIKENLPTIYDTTAVANAKLQTVQTLIANRENALLGSAANSSSTSVSPTYSLNGKTYVQGADGLYYPQ